MAITFTYTESTNVVEQTEGILGTPATPTHFVTADRAGTDTDLLVAASPGAAVSLTYAVRPVEDLAILVKCIVANKTAEADFIFITGKDWRGAAQTEGIDVTAGDGSYTSTKYWSEITTLDCSDNGAGGGNVWDDGDLSVTQDVWGVIWDYGNGQFTIDAKLAVGDGSTSTYFEIADGESVVFSGTTNSPQVKTEATFNLGQANGDYSQAPAFLKFPGQWTTYPFVNGGIFNCYGSLLIYTNNDLRQGAGTVNFKNSIIGGPDTTETISIIAASNWSDVYITRIGHLQLNFTPTTFSNVHIDQSNLGIRGHNNDVTAIGSKITNFVSADFTETADNLYVVNPIINVTTPRIFDAAGVIHEQYTCNIHVADKDGANLASITVLCEDTDGAQVFSVSTDANGDIVEQTINYKQWTTTNETLKEYTPHIFTFTKAGYETLVMENITVDTPIVWCQELQDTLQKRVPIMIDIGGDGVYKTLSEPLMVKI